MNRSLYVALPLLLLLTILQGTIFSHLSVFGVTPQLAVLVVINWTLLRGPYEGALWAFIAGFFLDLFSITPLGVTSLTLMAAVIVAARLYQVLPTNHIILPMLLSGLTMGLYLIAYLLLMRIIGFTFGWQATGTLVATVLFHGLLGLPVYWLLYVLDRALYPRPIAS